MHDDTRALVLKQKLSKHHKFHRKPNYPIKMYFIVCALADALTKVHFSSYESIISLHFFVQIHRICSTICLYIMYVGSFETNNIVYTQLQWWFLEKCFASTKTNSAFCPINLTSHSLHSATRCAQSI